MRLRYAWGSALLYSALLRSALGVRRSAHSLPVELVASLLKGRSLLRARASEGARERGWTPDV